MNVESRVHSSCYDLVDVERIRKLLLFAVGSAPTEVEREADDDVGLALPLFDDRVGGGKVTRNSARAFIDAPDGSWACRAEARLAAYLWSAPSRTSAPGRGEAECFMLARPSSSDDAPSSSSASWWPGAVYRGRRRWCDECAFNSWGGWGVGTARSRRKLTRASRYLSRNGFMLCM